MSALHNDVSRETMAALEHFSASLVKWNNKINLVANSTVGDVWDRHIKDSLQLWECTEPNFDNWADFGAGGGLPGIVIAILAKELSGRHVTLVESDARKCVFLSKMVSDLSLPCSVVSSRIEKTDRIGADILSARALASVSKLLEYAELHLAENGICLFLKGQAVQSELEEAQKAWNIDYTTIPSQTQAEASILKISQFQRV